MKRTLTLFILVFLGLCTVNAQKQKASTTHVNPRGLFCLQKFMYDKRPDLARPFDQYKYIGDEFTLTIKFQHLDNRRTIFTMLNQDKINFNYTGKKINGKNDTDFKIFDTEKDRFTLRWYNDYMKDNTVFPMNANIYELYTRDNILPFVQKAVDAVCMKIDRKFNKFAGIWRCEGITDNAENGLIKQEVSTSYKIYTPDALHIVSNLSLIAGNEHLLVLTEPVKYLDDNVIIEYAAKDTYVVINWLDENSYTATYLNNGKPVIEVWKRSGLPETFQKHFGTKEPIAE